MVNKTTMYLIVLYVLPIVMAKRFTDDEIIPARRLNGHTVKTIVPIKVDGCHRECRLRSDCLSLSFNHYYELCELHDYTSVDVSNLNIPDEKGWVYINVERKTYDDLGQCNGISCPAGAVCRDGNCMTDHCTPTHAINIVNGGVLGNMNNVGSRICVVCNVGFHLIGTDISECLADGSWSTLATCENVCPGTLALQNAGGYPTIVSANINTTGGSLTNINLINVNTVVREGSEVTFDCTGGAYLQSYQTVFCHDGQWIYMQGCEELQLGIDCYVSEACSNLPPSDECVNRICRCPLGTSYSYNERRCIERCPAGYADTFTEVKEVGQWGPYNIERLILSRSQCEDICISRTTYICRSFDYDYRWSECFLQEVTYFDDPPSVRGWNGGAYCLRDCL